MALQSLQQTFEISHMKSILFKSLSLTDDWLDYIKPGNDFENEIDQTNKFQSKYSVIGLENAEEQKKSILFASKSLLIRNNIYYIISNCLNAGLNKSDIERECNLIRRLVSDLMECKDNYFMFGNLLLTLDSFKDDVKFTCD